MDESTGVEQATIDRSGPAPGDVVVIAREVHEAMVAHATGTYSIPPGARMR